MRARIVPLFISVLLVACTGDSGVSSSEEQTNSQAHSTQITFKTIELQKKGGIKCKDTKTDADASTEDAAAGENLCATVKLTYPEMSSEVNPELAEKLNQFILRKIVDSPQLEDTNVPVPTLEAFAEAFIEDYQQDPNPFTSWELERSIKAVFSTTELVTLLFEEYGYMGGAHPFSGQRYTVISLTDGKQIEMADLLNPGYEPALNVAGEKIFRIVRELGEAASLEEHGFSFENNVFNLNENFGVLKEGLEFVFNSYEIAPYAMGPTQLMIPYEDIPELIRPDGPLGSTVR